MTNGGGVRELNWSDGFDIEQRQDFDHTISVVVGGGDNNDNSSSGGGGTASFTILTSGLTNDSTPIRLLSHTVIEGTSSRSTNASVEVLLHVGLLAAWRKPRRVLISIHGAHEQ